MLPQFKKSAHPPPHQFIVFSIVEDNDTVRPKLAQCNNCGIIHKVIDLCKSEILNGKEHVNSLLKIEDVMLGMNQQLSAILEANNADLPTCEMAKFLYDNKQWGNFVVLTSDSEAGIQQGKYVVIIGENLFKVESFSRENIVSA